MCFVNSHINTIIAYFTLQFKPVIPSGVNLSLTILFIVVFAISILASIYIIFRENKKSNLQRQETISPDITSTEPIVNGYIEKTEEKSEQKEKPEPTEERPDVIAVEADKEATEVAVKETRTIPQERVFKLFKAINPGNIRHSIKEKHDKRIEKLSVTTNGGETSLSIPSPDENSEVPITPSTSPGTELKPEFESPADELAGPDSLQLENNQPVIDESAISDRGAEDTLYEVEPYSEPPLTFAITDLTLRPQVIFPGNTVFISFKVTNYTDVSDYYTIVLKIGGFEMYSDHIYLSSMESKYITFPIKALHPGTWDIDINGVSTKMTIRG
jgi:hypothetical protein